MGIGKAVAERLASEGKRLVLVDRAAEALRATQSALIASGARAEVSIGDVADPKTAMAAVEQARQSFGRLDGLSHNAGIQRYGTALTTADDVWDEVIAVNLNSAFHFARAALPELIKTQGAIVMMAS